MQSIMQKQLNNSAIYEGVVTHCRLKPVLHSFQYKVFMMFIDLSEVEKIFNKSWFWSFQKWNLACFLRKDYLGDNSISLDEAVRNKVEQEVGDRPQGKICVLTNFRYFGYINNPITSYYCYDENDCYEHTLYLLEDGNILRGLYGAKDKKYLQKMLIEFNGFATLGPPTKQEVINYYEDKMTSYANNQISVSTDYSEIIIEHTTQYEQEWSDIKRRKLWLKNHQ